jgi:hypothetical protein
MFIGNKRSSLFWRNIGNAEKKVLKIAINLGRSVLALSISDNIDYSNGATTFGRKPFGRQTFGRHS